MKFVVVCNLPRSGSKLTASMLTASGACTGGIEYFETTTIPKYTLPKLGFASVEATQADVDGYVARLKQVFGTESKPLCVKIQWYQLVDWRERGLDLERHFPDAKYVFTTRGNLVAQTVSLVKALQTGGWTATAPTQDVTPKYGFWKMMYELARLQREIESWNAWFAEKRIEPYRIRYEDLDADYRNQALALLHWLGVKPSLLQRRRLKPPLAKQRDQLNRDWEDQFYRDLAHWHSQWELMPLEERRRIWGRDPG